MLKNALTISLALLGLIVFSFCKKESEGGNFRVTVTNVTGELGVAGEAWLALTREDGSHVASSYFAVNKGSFFPNYQEFTIETDKASAQEQLDLTYIFQSNNLSGWKIITWRKVTSSAKVAVAPRERGYPQTATIAARVTITGAPAIDSLDIPASESLVYLQTGNTIATGQCIVTSERRGFLMRVKEKGAPNWASYWKSHLNIEPLELTLPFTSFDPNFPKMKLRLPAPIFWNYKVFGVISEENIGQFVPIVTAATASPTGTYSEIEFETPPEADFASYYLFAENPTEKVSCEYLLKGSDDIILPVIDFGLTKAEKLSGNRIKSEVFGQFDALEIRFNINQFQTKWTVIGAPEDLVEYKLPLLPPWLQNQLPVFTVIGVDYAACHDYEAYSSFQDFTLRSTPEDYFWLAKAGRRTIWY